jgi:hypothetical protein
MQSWTVSPPFRGVKSLNLHRIAFLVEDDTGDAYSRVALSGDVPWEQIKMAIRTADYSGIEYTLHFKRISGRGLHNLPKSCQSKTAHLHVSDESGWAICPRQPMTASITFFDSSGPLTRMA